MLLTPHAVADCLADAPLPWLGGLRASEFLRDYWQKKPLLVRNAFPDLAHLLAPKELLELAETEDVESRVIVEDGADPWEMREGPFHPTVWRKLSQRKWTALVQAVDHYLPPLADLLDHFAFVPEWRIDDVMVSYAVPGGSVGAHFDQYDVFLLQGPGQRRWQLGEQCNDDTPRLEHAQLRLIADMPVTFDEILGPGDLLYVPPGLGHFGVAQTECLTYSVGFRAPSLGHILEQVVDAVLLERGTEQLYSDAGRALPSHPSELGLSDVTTLATTLQSWLQQPLLFPTALAPFLSEAKYDDYEPEGEPCTLADLRAALSEGIDLLRDPASRWLWESQTQTFWRNGAVVTVPDAVKPYLPQLLTGRRHVAATLAQLPEAVLSWLAEDISAGYWLPIEGAASAGDAAGTGSH